MEDIKPPLDVVCLGKKRCKRIRGRKIMEIGGSLRGRVCAIRI